MVFTKLHAGGKFGAGSYASSGGLHGVGASVVNALSERLDVEVDRHGRTWAMSFRRGEPGTFAGDGPDAPFTPFTTSTGLRDIAKVPKTRTGTRIRYWADRQVFARDARFALDDLLDRARQTAFLVPGLHLVIDDLRPDAVQRQYEFRFDGGISEYAEYLAQDAALTETWRLGGTGHFTETVPVLQADGTLVSQDLERECQVDIAVRWGTGYETEIRSYVNIIATPKGGSHLAGFDAGLLKALRKQVTDNARKLGFKPATDKLERDDVVAGLTAVLTVRLPEPQFEGQTKEVLGTPAVRGIVSNIVDRELTKLFTDPPRGQKQVVGQVLEKIVSEMRARVSARQQKETQRRKSALENSSLPAKLVDCRSNDVANSELFIVEGDSALGTAKLARDSEFQALLPIRGKILNVQKASIADMLSNAECAAIIQVIGAGSGRTFDLDAARYGKVIIMSDADVDGAHIRTLLLTLFFRYMRPLIESGRVFAAVPPLHRVIVQNPGTKPNDVIYTYSEPELNGVLADLRKRGRRYQDPIQRYKGLGEMDADQLASTTMERSGRTLRRVQLVDAQVASDMFELLMGNDVTPRRDFLMDGSSRVGPVDIDV